MVYSQTKRTSSISSITNQAQGGGSKKAGLPYIIGRDSATSVAFRGTIQNISPHNPLSLQFPLTTTTNPSRPIGARFQMRYGF